MLRNARILRSKPEFLCRQITRHRPLGPLRHHFGLGVEASGKRCTGGLAGFDIGRLHDFDNSQVQPKAHHHHDSLREANAALPLEASAILKVNTQSSGSSRIGAIVGEKVGPLLPGTVRLKW